MKKSLAVGLVAFTVCYLTMSALITWVLNAAGVGLLANYSILPNLVAAPCAILVGLYAGRLTPTSVAICSLFAQLIVFAGAVAVAVKLSWPPHESVTWSPFLDAVVIGSAGAWAVSTFFAVGLPMLSLRLIHAAKE